MSKSGFSEESAWHKWKQDLNPRFVSCLPLCIFSCTIWQIHVNLNSPDNQKMSEPSAALSQGFIYFTHIQNSIITQTNKKIPIRLITWAQEILMRSNKSKCKMLHLGLGEIPDMRADREENSLRAACREGLGGSCRWKGEKMNQQCVLPVQKTSLILEGDSAHVTPLGVPHQSLGSSTQEANLQEWVQRRARKIIRGLDHFSYEDRLRGLMSFSLEKTRLHGNVTADFPCLKRAYKKVSENLFV